MLLAAIIHVEPPKVVAKALSKKYTNLDAEGMQTTSSPLMMNDSLS